jgi:hypothetical protein
MTVAHPLNRGIQVNQTDEHGKGRNARAGVGLWCFLQGGHLHAPIWANAWHVMGEMPWIAASVISAHGRQHG